MKKKLLLAVLPALLVLAGCSGISQQPKANLMLEDTAAHEEIFGEARAAGELQIRKANDEPTRDVVNPLEKPKIGVQYKLENGLYSIRYVAAITSLDVTATWTRGVAAFHQENGNEVPDKPTASFETTKAYLELQDGDKTSTASAQYPGYNYYVVYTMWNIPASSKDVYMFAYLTIEDGNGDKAYSDALVSKIEENTNYFGFDHNSSGFFLATTKADNSLVSIPADNPIRDNNNAATFTADFGVGDKFVVMQKESNYFKVWNGECLGDAGYGFAKANEKVSVDTATRYVVYLNKSNGIYHTQYGIEKTMYYVRGDAAGGWDVTESSAYRMVTDPDNKAVLLNVHLSVGDFKIGDVTSNWSGYNLGSDHLIGGAKEKGYVSQTNGGAYQSNIHCNNAGYYNLYLTNNDYISIENVSLD